MTARRVLVPTDFSENADLALAHAVHLADRFGASLHLLHVVGELNAAWNGLAETEDRSAELEARIQSEVEERVQRMASDHSSVGVQTEVVQQPNVNVVDTVLEYVDGHDIDFVVMGTRGRRGIGRLMLGSVANRAIRQAPCPVMTVRAETEKAVNASHMNYQDILVPIDFSEYSRKALRLSKDVAARHGAHLQLMFIAEKRVVPTFSDTGLPGVSVVEMDPDIVENAQDALREVDEHVGGPSVESTYHVQEGEVAQEIVDFAETNETDLVVMATRGQTGITRFVLGSNTERVVRAAPCPVLTVSPSSPPADE